MACRRFLLGVVAAASLVSACGSSSDTGAVTDETIGGVQATAVANAAPAQVGGIGDAVEVAVGALNGADAAACDLEYQTLTIASEAYLALNGSLPATQDALVEAQLLREPSKLLQIGADGTIVPAPGSPCV